MPHNHILIDLWWHCCDLTSVVLSLLLLADAKTVLGSLSIVLQSNKSLSLLVLSSSVTSIYHAWYKDDYLQVCIIIQYLHFMNVLPIIQHYPLGGLDFRTMRWLTPKSDGNLPARSFSIVICYGMYCQYKSYGWDIWIPVSGLLLGLQRGTIS